MLSLIQIGILQLVSDRLVIRPDIVQLSRLFREHVDALRSSGYAEIRHRREFIRSVFRALGWNEGSATGYSVAR